MIAEVEIVGKVTCEEHTHAEVWIVLGEDDLRNAAISQLVEALVRNDAERDAARRQLNVFRGIPGLIECHTNHWGEEICVSTPWGSDGDSGGGPAGGTGGTDTGCHKVDGKCKNNGRCRGTCKDDGYGGCACSY